MKKVIVMMKKMILIRGSKILPNRMIRGSRMSLTNQRQEEREVNGMTYQDENISLEKLRGLECIVQM